jgi:Do/DeqQ family serine protease
MLLKYLSSKKTIAFNLVLLGALFGFALAFLSFSCSAGSGTGVVSKVKAEETASVGGQGALGTAMQVQSALRDVAKKVVPSVVELKTVSVVEQQMPNFPNFNGIPWEFFFGPGGPNGQGNKKNQNNDRKLRTQGLGSGIVIRRDKSTNTYSVLTNNHVVSNEQTNKPVDEISVETDAGNEYKAKIVGRDERRDLALVSFETSDDIPVAVLGDSDAVEVGDWAIAVGNPLGFANSVTQGIISAVGRTGGPGNNINDFLQTDASINQGNSGGALCNIKGEVIGINMWIASSSGGGSVGLGFAIPINNAKRSINAFIKNHGQVSDGWLGVSLMELASDDEVTKELGLPNVHGALASDVFKDSPADKAGIQPGDFITKVDGKEMPTLNRLMQTVADLQPGNTYTFTVLRDKQEKTFNVKIVERTDKVAGENKGLWPGLYVHPIDDDIRDAFRLDKDAKGLVVMRVIEQSPAAVINVQRGDIVTSVNGKIVKTVADFYDALRNGKTFWLSILRDGNALETLRYNR